MRPKFFGRYLAPEMVALSMAEMILTFVLTLVTLAPTAAMFRLQIINPAIICALTVGFVAYLIGLYRPQIFVGVRSLIFNTVLSSIVSFPAVWIMSKLFHLDQYWPVGYDPYRPIKIILVWSASVFCIRLLFFFAAKSDLFLHRAAVVCPDGSASAAASARASRKGFLEIRTVRAEKASALELNAEKVRTLIFPHDAGSAIVPAIRDEYRRNGISIQNQAEFWERHLRRIDVTSLDERWFDQLDSVSSKGSDTYVTRVFDIAVSLSLLLATLPIMLAIALIVRLDSLGPVLYRQERLGLQNKPFTLLKFRSMRLNAESAGPRWAQQRDPRVTRVGSFMRKTRVDELPQLLNILRGEMSFIGPRPERPHFVEQLCQVIPCYHERARVKPGLTGWAQVNYPYGASVEDARAKLSYDLYYVKNRTLMLDLLILLSTVRVILLQEGAR